MLKAFEVARAEVVVFSVEGAAMVGACSAWTAALVAEFDPVLPAFVAVVAPVIPVVPVVVVPVVVVVWATAPPAKRAEMAEAQRTR